jgi:hypothetical protein
MFLITLFPELTYKRSIFCTWEFRMARLHGLNFSFAKNNVVDHQQQRKKLNGGGDNYMDSKSVPPGVSLPSWYILFSHYSVIPH